MNAEVDDPDVYHQDFTTASAWEEFVDRIEKIIVDWKLNQPKPRLPLKKGDLDGEWTTRTEEVHFEGTFYFSMSLWRFILLSRTVVFSLFVATGGYAPYFGGYVTLCSLSKQRNGVRPCFHSCLFFS